MRYRAMTAGGDYQFAGNTQFLTDSPAAVAQAILTRMRLYVGEWFLDEREGLNKAKILGYGTMTTYDPEIQRRILLTRGVKAILEYGSIVENRALKVTARVDTIYGPVTINESF